MAELLKNMYNKEFLLNFSDIIKLEYDNFNKTSFINYILNDDWVDLELKQRTRKITNALGKYLPNDYSSALAILLNIKEKCSGHYTYVVFPDFVCVFGTDEEYFDLSMNALKLFTEHSTSEFAIRTFILMYPDKTMEYMYKWAKDDNEHIRRLASEGCRPRLPWGQSLPEFKKNPTSVLKILELLNNDPSLYVRKSVANNLNDISKDNPDIVINIVKRWQKLNNTYTNWIIRHGCRTLIKSENNDAMNLFGYDANIQIQDVTFDININNVTTNDFSYMNYYIKPNIKDSKHIRLEYGIYYVKSNGTTSLKKFLISDKIYEPNTIITGSKKHNWQNRTTRKQYSGEHKIVLILNSKVLAHSNVFLKVL